MKKEPRALLIGVTIFTLIPILVINIAVLGFLGWMIYSAFENSVLLGVFLVAMLVIMLGGAIKLGLVFRRRFRAASTARK